jgi:hypothetical protein
LAAGTGWKRLPYFFNGLDEKLAGVEPVEPIRQII